MLRHQWLPAFILLALPSLAGADDVTAEKTKDGVAFKVGKEVVARYMMDPKYSKPFLYPVHAPGGVPVTRAWPIEKGLPGEATTDHVHQKSVWFCHGDVIPEGIELRTKTAERNGKGVDFWSETKDKEGKPRHGTIRVAKVAGIARNDRGGVEVTTINEWLSPDGVKILDETRVIHLYDLPQGRLFIFDIKLDANVCPITFGDTKEGSFGIRVHDSLRPSLKDGATVTTADGKSLPPPQKDSWSIWGQPTAWIDYSGKVNGAEVGIAVFEQPGLAAPANWHVRVYGLNAANPFARELSGFPSQKGKKDLVKISEKGSLKLRYGVYAHSGDVKTGKVADAFETFKNSSR